MPTLRPFFLKLFMCIHVCVYACCVHGGQKVATDSLELELTGGCELTLRNKLEPSARAPAALNR